MNFCCYSVTFGFFAGSCSWLLLGSLLLDCSVVFGSWLYKLAPSFSSRSATRFSIFLSTDSRFSVSSRSLSLSSLNYVFCSSTIVLLVANIVLIFSDTIALILFSLFSIAICFISSFFLTYLFINNCLLPIFPLFFCLPSLFLVVYAGFDFVSFFGEFFDDVF